MYCSTLIALAFFYSSLFFATPANAMLIRSADGTSNNLTETQWGAAGSALIRRTAPAYADGQGEPRGGDPSALANPRTISNALSHQSSPTYNRRRASDWLWQWGQFLDHDLDLSPTASSTDAFDINVPAGDAYFDPMNTGDKTISLHRSLYTLDSAGVRQQTNTITAYIDGSNVYGSDSGRATILSTDTGKLRMSDAANGEILMGRNDVGYHNDQPSGPGIDPTAFYLAGDIRANEQIGLTAVHTVFAREHNRLVDNLKSRLDGGEAVLIVERNATIMTAANGINDESDFLYEAARKIVGAKIQKITYDEFLPVLLGVDLTDAYTGYDENVNAGISNEFSAAAFRLGHTMLPSNLLRVDGNGVTTEAALRNAFFNPGEVFQNGIDSLLLGLASRQAQAIDTLLVDDVRNFLFGPPGAGGLDLASLNIQRGRDHGIGSLNEVRTALGLDPYAEYSELTGGDAALASAFAQVYRSIDDVDLWIGGLAEAAFNQSMLGETFTRILFDQFTRSMFGDRFFFLGELDIIDVLDPDFMDTSLAAIIEQNSSVDIIQANAFLTVPEPSTAALFIVGCAIGWTRSRRLQ